MALRGWRHPKALVGAAAVGVTTGSSPRELACRLGGCRSMRGKLPGIERLPGAATTAATGAVGAAESHLSVPSCGALFLPTPPAQGGG